MALVPASQFSASSNFVAPVVSLHSQFIPKKSSSAINWGLTLGKKIRDKSVLLANPPGTSCLPMITCSSSPHKLVRDPKLDKHVVKQNKIRFVQKLKTLLLSKPKHFLPVHILHKCRSYLSLPRPRSMISMIRRYPTIFEFFTIPTPPFPYNAVGPLSQVCVRLTPAATALAKKESDLKKRMTLSLTAKLQKLLMLASPHHRILLSKLVHLGPDFGLPVNFRSRLCNDHPDKFKVVDTSYGRALELVSWDSKLANVIPSYNKVESLGLIVDRPLKFKHLKLRKGLNVKRHHRDHLIKFNEIPDVCPYTSTIENLVKESIEAEKRACALVREVLGMTLEKRTLVDHLTHFRNDFCLPNKLRGMLVRHPELFYISIKGQRDSVFLSEGYSDKGKLLQKDEILMLKDELMDLVRDGKRFRREERKGYILDDAEKRKTELLSNHVDLENFGDYEDGLDDLFELDESSSEGELEDIETGETVEWLENEFWTAEATSLLENVDDCNAGSVPW